MMQSQQYKHNAELLISVPGIGPTVSTLFLLEIGDIRRFPSFEQLNNFVGFYPGSDDSGEKHQSTGISPRKHKQLRSHLIEAAWLAIRIDPALLEAYRQLTKRMDGKKAIIRIARKLLRRMRSVLLTETPYQMGIVA
jgi:transposase